MFLGSLKELIANWRPTGTGLIKRPFKTEKNINRPMTPPCWKRWGILFPFSGHITYQQVWEEPLFSFLLSGALLCCNFIDPNVVNCYLISSALKPCNHCVLFLCASPVRMFSSFHFASMPAAHCGPVLHHCMLICCFACCASFWKVGLLWCRALSMIGPIGVSLYWPLVNVKWLSSFCYSVNLVCHSSG